MKTFDPKCYELAALFLEDANMADVTRIAALAGEIQGVIEDFIQHQETVRIEAEFHRAIKDCEKS